MFNFLNRLVFIGAATLTVTAFINDRKEGFWNRTLLANVSLSEIITSQIITNSIAMFVQISICLVTLKLCFSYVVILGSVTALLLIVVLAGFAGLFFGLMVSCILEDFVGAIYILIGKFLTGCFLSGELALFAPTMQPQLQNIRRNLLAA